MISIKRTVYPLDYNRNSPDFNGWVHAMQPAFDEVKGTDVTGKLIDIELDEMLRDCKVEKEI